MKFIEYPNPDVMMVEVANRIGNELMATLSRRSHASLAVPGGSTPGPVFDVLSTVNLDWNRVTVLPTDERWVAETDDHSNSRMIRERLLVGRAEGTDFLTVISDCGSIEDWIENLDRTMQGYLPLSVLMLGMGSDMHTASLFPRSDGLEQAMREGAPAFLPIRQHGGGPVEQRISLTLPALKGALNTHLLIVGPEKLNALERAKQMKDPMLAPVMSILPDATVHWAR